MRGKRAGMEDFFYADVRSTTAILLQAPGMYCLDGPLPFDLTHLSPLTWVLFWWRSSRIFIMASPAQLVSSESLTVCAWNTEPKHHQHFVIVILPGFYHFPSLNGAILVHVQAMAAHMLLTLCARTSSIACWATPTFPLMYPWPLVSHPPQQSFLASLANLH